MGTETLLLVAVILMLADVFFPTDFPTLIAYGIFSYIISTTLSDSFLYQIIIGMVSWWAMAAFHFYVWRKFIKQITDRYISPTKLRSGVSAYSGKEATIYNIADRLMVKIEDELYPFCEESNLPCNSGDKVTIIKYANEKMLVKRKL
jgi:membrane protein implicated in regulation of membrane protease activity